MGGRTIDVELVEGGRVDCVLIIRKWGFKL